MNRVLRRPMFRTGGSAEGLTSGLQPRKGYYGTGNASDQRVLQDILPGMTIGQMRDLSRELSYRPQRNNLRDFLIGFGLDIASRPPSGSIFSTAAGAGKEAFGKFQQAKQMEQAYGMKETEADRALIANMIKGMDEDTLSALMKDVKAGVDAGLWTEQEGIKKLLQKKVYGVLDEPGEAENARIRELELMISRDQEVPAGMIKSVAQHIYKIETNAYPEEVQKDLNRTKTYIKPNHISGVNKNEAGEVIEIVVDANYARTYTPGQIYFEPQTGELFKNVSKAGDEAPRFVKVIFD